MSQTNIKSEKKNEGRKFFGNHQEVMAMPDLIEIQKDSYRWFLEEGLAELFDEINPISDFIGRDLELYLEDYYLDEPKFNETKSTQQRSHGNFSLAINTNPENFVLI